MGGKSIDMTEKIYGRLMVLHHVGVASYGRALWLCRCECGTKKVIRGDNLTSGLTRSCGCLQIERTKVAHTKHGQRRLGLNRERISSRLYRLYTQMKNRCTNPRNSAYRYYGGRGITVCPEWQDFVVFAAWAHSNGYHADLTIDRIDNDKGYAPDNCQWLTRADNTKKQWTAKRESHT